MLANVTTTQSDFWTFFWPLFVSGLGLAQIFVPLTISVLASVHQRDIPAAAVFFNLARQIGGSIAIAVLVTILARSNAIHHTELGSRIALSQVSPVADYLRANGGAGSAQAAAALDRLVSQQSAVIAYADTARAVAVISFLLSPLAFILRRPRLLALPAK